MTRNGTFASALLLIALAPRVHAVGKVSSDPNRGQLAMAMSAPDKRLASKVTLKSGGKRLRDVAEELTAANGIRIRCGKNTADWQVRDLPVTVFAKDVPLSKLLGWVAEAAHVTIVSRKASENDSVTSLTLRRDKKDEKELQDDEARGLAEASWCWDAVAKLGQQPKTPPLDSDTGKHEASVKLVPQPSSSTPSLSPAAKQALARRLAAQIISSLPAEAKDSVFAGEAVLLDAKSSPQAKLIREMVPAMMSGGMSSTHMVASGYGLERSRVEPSESDPKQTMLTVQLFDFGGQKGAAPVFVLSPMVYGALVTSCDYALRPTDAEANGLGMPPRPQARPSDNDPDYDCGGSKRHFITSDKDWEAPVLQTKVHLDLPKDNRTYTDVLSALAEASGYSVVCEDFVTCRVGPSNELKDMPADTTIGEVLKKLNACWFSVDEKDRLILGRARNWRGHQRDLVPQAAISNLMAKIYGAGAELDDVTPLASFTTGQMTEWVRENPDLQDAKFHLFFTDKMLWRVYDSLTADAKAQAKTDAGVPLLGLDADALREDFRRLRRYNELTITMHRVQDELEKLRVVGEAKMRTEMLADPAQLQTAILRIKSKDLATVVPNGHQCWMELEFPTFTLRVDGGPGVFPMRAEKKAVPSYESASAIDSRAFAWYLPVEPVCQTTGSHNVVRCF